MEPHLLQISADAMGLLAAVLGTTVAAVVAGFGLLFRHLMSSHQERVIAVEAERDTWKKLFLESEAIIDAVVNKGGKQRVPKLAPVIPEHNSPVTEAQRVQAELSAARATVTAQRLALGLTARTETDDPNAPIEFVDENEGA